MAQDGVQNDDGSFVRARLQDIIERKEAIAEDVMEDPDLSQGSPLKQIIDVNALEHEHIWELMEEVYYAGYYQDAHGDQLDKLLGIAHINRRRRRGATGVVNFSTQVANDEDIIIREGTRVATERTDSRPAIPFKTTEPARLPAGSHAVNNVPIRACEPWETDLDPQWLGEETNVGANTITRFETAVRGVDKVTNPYPTGAASRDQGFSFIEGRDRETDRELRNRFERKFGSEAHATLDGIRTNVLDVNEVLNVGVEENVENTVVGDLPPKSFRVTVLGDPAPGEVAQAIYDKRPAGIESYGDVSDTAVGADNTTRKEYWTWAEEVPVYVNVEVTHDSEFPSDGALQVQNAVIKYVGGETVEGEEFLGTGMGEDVIEDLIHAAVMNVMGVWSADVYLDTSENPSATEDIEITGSKTALTHYSDVNIFTSEQERS